jgi:hypothetical protein
MSRTVFHRLNKLIFVKFEILVFLDIGKKTVSKENKNLIHLLSALGVLYANRILPRAHKHCT